MTPRKNAWSRESAANDGLTLVTGLGTRNEVQQRQHREYRDEREGDPYRVGLCEPDVQKDLGDQTDGAHDEGEQPYDDRLSCEEGGDATCFSWVATRGTLTVPHDPYPRALGAVTLQEVQSAAVEHALLDRILPPRGPHGELSEFVRQDESADRRADAEEERAVGEYQERVLCGAVDALAVVRIFFDEGEEEDLDDGEQRCLLMGVERGGRRIDLMRVWRMDHVKKGAYHYGRYLICC